MKLDENSFNEIINNINENLNEFKEEFDYFEKNFEENVGIEVCNQLELCVNPKINDIEVTLDDINENFDDFNYKFKILEERLLNIEGVLNRCCEAINMIERYLITIVDVQSDIYDCVQIKEDD